jgi:hypothetical protein
MHGGEKTFHVEPSFGADAAPAVFTTANTILSSRMGRTILSEAHVGGERFLSL